MLAIVCPPAHSHEAGSQMAEFANAFLGSLQDEQRAKAIFAFEDEERTNWHFIPRERKGLAVKELTQQQQLLAHALMASGLGFRGMMKAETIMSLEEVLYQLESAADESKRSATREKRDPEKYYVSIFGKPQQTGNWAWRIEGHHLSMNFTLKDGQLLSATPSFFGTNPGEVRDGPMKGLRVLHNEEELGRTLVKSLNEDQMKQVIVTAEAPKEMLTAAERQVKPLDPRGLPDSAMTAEQKQTLHLIIQEYLQRLRPEVADEAWKEIQASGQALTFGWAGGRERGEPHYYRVQGKTFLLEYDNVQNGANHVHSVWRDFDGDFGRDLLGEHRAAEHTK
jgi:Protein of unknown function (DUF3500)